MFVMSKVLKRGELPLAHRLSFYRGRVVHSAMLMLTKIKVMKTQRSKEKGSAEKGILVAKIGV
jgi:hypothetical protein